MISYAPAIGQPVIIYQSGKDKAYLDVVDVTGFDEKHGCWIVKLDGVRLQFKRDYSTLAQVAIKEYNNSGKAEWKLYDNSQTLPAEE